MLKKIINIILLSVILLGDTLNYNQELYNVKLKKPDMKPIMLNDLTTKEKEENLPLFKVSCNGIKYTGAYEQVWIDALKDTRNYIKTLIEPYTTFSKLDAAIFVYTFPSCMQEELKKEIKGDETHTSLAEKAMIAAGFAGVDAVIKTGITGSAQGNVDVEVEKDVKINPHSEHNKIVQQTSDEGTFTNVVRCMMRKRQEIYLKLYNLLTYSLKTKLLLYNVLANDCYVALKKKDETVPSWTELLGIDTTKIKEYLSETFETDSNSSKTMNAIKNYFKEVAAVDIKFNGKMCVNFDISTGKCKKYVDVNNKNTCVNGIDVLTGNTCNTNFDNKFIEKYGNTKNNTNITLFEKYFLILLSNSDYIKNQYIYDFFFNNPLILTTWNVFLGRKDGLLKIKLLPRNNFQAYQVNYQRNNVDYNKIIIRNNSYAILSDSDFDKNLLYYLARKKCGDNKVCLSNLYNIKYTNKLDYIWMEYKKLQKKFDYKLNLIGNSNTFKPDEKEYQKRLDTIKNALKSIFNSNYVYRIFTFKSDFLYYFPLVSQEYINTLKLKGVKQQDINDFKNFVQRFYMLFNVRNDKLNIVQEQLDNLSDKNQKTIDMNLQFMEINSLLDKTKANFVKKLFEK